MSDQSLRRREMLRLTAAVGAASLLAACLPTTSSPTGGPTAVTAAPRRIGRFELGTLEGAEIITDPSQFPKSFKEAPELAALVQQGKLPKVEERVGQDPLIVKPAHGIGKYGGTMRKANLGGGTGDLTGHRFLTGPGSWVYVDPQWKKIVPNIARGWEMSADGKVLTIQMRRGMKWSDGAPFTADDVLFWYEDIYGNKQLFPGSSPDLTIGGKPVTIRKVDQYSFQFVSPQPNFLLLDRLSSPLGDLGGPGIRGQLGRGGYAPKHYLSKFHPKYIGQAEADRLATDGKFNGWVDHFQVKSTWRTNTELPVLFPWRTTVPANNPAEWVMERNPYSVWVDTDGNQLPYIGTVQHTVAQSLEFVALRATAGEYDFQDQLLDVGKLPVLIDNQQRGGYKTSLDPDQAGIGLMLNLAYEEDMELGDLIRMVDFRRALSLGIDRAQINEAIFLGTGTVGSIAPPDDNKYFPGNEWRTKWSTLDVAQANQLLDKIGLTQKDSEGFRLRKDGKRVRVPFLVVAGRITDFAAVGEMIKQHWSKIGIELLIENVTSALAQQRIQANSAVMIGNTVGSDEVFLFSSTLIPQAGGFAQVIGVPFAQWIQSGGKQGREPIQAVKQVADLLERGKTAAEKDRIDLGKEVFRQHIDQVLTIGIVTSSLVFGGVRIAKTNLGNVPGRVINSNTLLSVVNSMPQTFYFR
jgi:peptide/nickel transport system substrate-binding protein